MIKPVRKVRKLEAVSNCGSSCPGKRQSGGKARSSFPALSGSAGTTGRITGRRGGRHEETFEARYPDGCQRERTRRLFTENWIQLSRIVAWCGSQLLGWTVEQLSDNATHRVDEQTGKTLGPLFSQVSIEAGINIIGGQWRVTKAGGWVGQKAAPSLLGSIFSEAEPR